MTEPATAVPARISAWTGLPRWVRIGLIALLAVVVALAAIVAVRIATRHPAVPLGVTTTTELRIGSCLAEAGVDLPEYTVVPCPVPHAQQVFATADVELPGETYASAGEALAAFADEVCARYLEYRLFLVADLETSSYTTAAIAVPTPDEYAAGDTEALCAVSAADGSELRSDLHQPAP